MRISHAAIFSVPLPPPARGLGPAERIETGDANGRMWAAGLELGATTGAGPLSVRPLAGLRYERVEVGAYSEAGGRSTRATFGDQTAESLLGSIGAELGLAQAASRTARPFLRITYEADLLDDARRIAITPSGAPVAFTTEAFSSDRDHFAWSAGVSAELRPGLAATAQVAGTLGRGSAEARALRFGVLGRF